MMANSNKYLTTVIPTSTGAVNISITTTTITITPIGV